MLCKLESPPGTVGTSCRSSRGRPFARLWPAGLAAVAALVLVASVLTWLDLVPAGSESKVAAAEDSQAIAPETPPAVSQSELLAALVRYGTRPEGATPADFPMVDVLLATPFYFESTGRTAPEASAEEPSVWFYVSESVHTGELPSNPPAPFLTVNSVSHRPSEVRLLTDSPHHRTTQLRYEAVSEDGSPLLGPDTHHLELAFQTPSAVEVHGSSLTWELPVSYGPAYSSAQVTLGDSAGAQLHKGIQDNEDSHLPASHEHRLNAPGLPGLGGSPWSLLSIPVLLGVILAALTPCLIDLSVYYGAYLGGAGAATGTSPARSALIKSALFFILGLVIVYTAGGALAGQAGQLLQRFGLVIEWSRPLGIAGGAVIILVALRMLVMLRSPMSCRLPFMRPASGEASSPLRSTLMGSTFAAQCFSCFSGTIISALILYAGTSGSPLTGGLLMLAFSLGLGAMLLLSVVLMTRFVPVIKGLKKLRPHLGLASSVLMIGIGASMILDKEHLLSDTIYRILGIS